MCFWGHCYQEMNIQSALMAQFKKFRQTCICIVYVHDLLVCLLCFQKWLPPLPSCHLCFLPFETGQSNLRSFGIKGHLLWNPLSKPTWKKQPTNTAILAQRKTKSGPIAAVNSWPYVSGDSPSHKTVVGNTEIHWGRKHKTWVYDDGERVSEQDANNTASLLNESGKQISHMKVERPVWILGKLGRDKRSCQSSDLPWKRRVIMKDSLLGKVDGGLAMT